MQHFRQLNKRNGELIRAATMTNFNTKDLETFCFRLKVVWTELEQNKYWNRLCWQTRNNYTLF